MNATHTVVILIGRNVKGVPMTDEMWHNFKTSVVDSVRIVGGTVIQKPSMAKGPAGQVGVWEGATEGAATVVALISNRCVEADRLRWLLDMDRMAYDQDAIGYIVVEGTDHLIGA